MMTPNEQCPYFDSAGVAQFFHVSLITVRRWTTRGILKGQKIGKFWRFTKEDLHRFGRYKT